LLSKYLFKSYGAENFVANNMVHKGIIETLGYAVVNATSA